MFGRKRLSFEWNEILGEKIMTIDSIAEKIGKSIPATRRHVRYAVAVGQLKVIKRKKRKYYMVPRVYDEIVRRRVDRIRESVKGL